MSGVRAVILDIDGTLIQSNDAHASAFVEAGAELGYEVSHEEVLRRIGMGSDKLIPQVFGVEKESEEGKRIEARKAEIFADRYLPGLHPTPGARDLLVRLRRDGLTLAVATSASPDDLEKLLDRAGVADLIPREKSASPEEVDESKPAPDVVQAALRKAGCAPGEAIMIGDTPYDVEAAGRAGVAILAVRSGGWRDRDLEGAAAIFDDPADLLAHYDETPLTASGA
jgi:HAD superfamily hydrolase (TIGR01509 family)